MCEGKGKIAASHDTGTKTQTTETTRLANPDSTKPKRTTSTSTTSRENVPPATNTVSVSPVSCILETGSTKCMYTNLVDLCIKSNRNKVHVYTQRRSLLARRLQREKLTRWPLRGMRCGWVAPGAHLCGDNWGVGAQCGTRCSPADPASEHAARGASVRVGPCGVAAHGRSSGQGGGSVLAEGLPEFEAHVAEPWL